MPAPLRWIEFRDFLGLNDSENPTALDSREAATAQNVETTDGAIRKCFGTVQTADAVAGATTVYCPGYDYVTRSGTRKHLRTVTIGGNTALQYNNAGAWTTIGAGTEMGAALPSFVTWPANDLLFIADKTGTLRLKYDGTQLVVWGLPTPGVAPSLGGDGYAALAVVVGGGNLGVGFYGVVYTYYNSTTTEESNAQSTVASIPTANTAALDRIDVTVDRDTWYTTQAATGFDKIRIYRTTVASTAALAQAGTFYLDTTVSTDSIDGAGGKLSDAAAANRTVRLSQSDTALTAAGTLLGYNNDRPLGMKYIVAHRSRIFGAGNATNPHYLYYSQLTYPENWPAANFFALDKRDTGGLPDITGLMVYQDQLYVFTIDQMFILRGTDNSDFLLERLPHGIGCVSHHTIQAWDRYVFWWSQQGPVMWDGSTPTFIGESKIRTLLRWTAANSTDWTNAGSPLALDPADLGNLESEILKQSGRFEYWTTFQRRGQATKDRILVYDVARESWSLRLFTAHSLGIVKDANNLDRLYLGDYGGLVLEAQRGFNHNGAAISAIWESPWLAVGKWNRGRVPLLKVLLRPRDGSLLNHGVVVRWYQDFSSTEALGSGVTVPFLSTRERAKRIYLGAKCDFLRVRFENLTASQDFAVESFALGVRITDSKREVA